MAQSVTAPPRWVIRQPVAFDGGAFWQDVVRRLRAGDPGLSVDDQRFLTDLGMGRYKLGALARLIDIATRCGEDEHAFALCDAIEFEIAKRRQQRELSLPELIRAEDAGEHVGNVAVREFTLLEDALHARVAEEQLHIHERRIRRLRHGLACVAGRLS